MTAFRLEYVDKKSHVYWCDGAEFLDLDELLELASRMQLQYTKPSEDTRKFRDGLFSKPVTLKHLDDVKDSMPEGGFYIKISRQELAKYGLMIDAETPLRTPVDLFGKTLGKNETPSTDQFLELYSYLDGTSTINVVSQGGYLYNRDGDYGNYTDKRGYTFPTNQISKKYPKFPYLMAFSKLEDRVRGGRGADELAWGILLFTAPSVKNFGKSGEAIADGNGEYTITKKEFMKEVGITQSFVAFQGACEIAKVRDLEELWTKMTIDPTGKLTPAQYLTKNLPLVRRIVKTLVS